MNLASQARHGDKILGGSVMEMKVCCESESADTKHIQYSSFQLEITYLNQKNALNAQKKNFLHAKH